MNKAILTLQFASDLHLEHPDNTNWLNSNKLTASADILILAGDVYVIGSQNTAANQFFDWCEKNFKQTYIVPGNHEFYGTLDVADSLNNFSLSLRNNVHVINNKSVIVNQCELFFTTLWAPIDSKVHNIANEKMVDFKKIHFQQKLLTPSDSITLHNTCFNWLKMALARSTAKKKIVVTHHCPVPIEDPQYNNGLTSAFIAPINNFVTSCNAIAWIFGHTHYNAAQGTKINGTTLLTNQLGYAKYGICNGFSINRVFPVLL